MANKTLFQTVVGKLIPKADTVNEEGAPAYQLSPKHSLAQFAATGCLNATFYATAQGQLKQILELCDGLEPEFIAKTAVYCREKGFMKDVPALLCAVLSVTDPEALKKVFHRTIDNGKMLRNFVQIMRSGAVGRKSLGSLPKRLIREWLAAHRGETLFRTTVGQNPSLADVIKMVHPRPESKAREALYGYILGKEHNADRLPELVQAFESFKKDKSLPVPNVPFQMLTALDLGSAEWTEIARNAPWRMTVMNLNTFARHGVFDPESSSEEVNRLIAERIRNPEAIGKAKVFPYQVMVAYTMLNEKVPPEIKEALQDAMEIAIKNVPEFGGKVYVCPDVSGSMTHGAVTGYRKGSTSSVRCIDVAALVAAAIVRKNSDAEVIPFEQDVVSININSRDSVMTNAEKLAGIGGGGTNCSAPLALLNRKKAKGDLVVFVSDYESWVDAKGYYGTATLREWNIFKKRNPEAQLICIDIQPYRHSQAPEREDILNIGGFSDQVFDVISRFTESGQMGDHWVDIIDQVEL